MLWYAAEYGFILFQGNVSVCKSPDEYTIQVDSSRGMKEFQFDTIFMPESTQDKVFEDTNVSHTAKIDQAF